MQKIIQIGSFITSGTVLQFVAQLRMEAILISHILDGANLVLGIHIGESSANDTRSVGYLSMLAIHMSGSSASLVAKHIRTSWNLRFRRDQVGYISCAGSQQTNDLDMETGRVIVE